MILLSRTTARLIVSSGIMVSAADSGLACTDLVFMKPRAKVNDAYRRDALPSKQLMQAIRHTAGQRL